MTETNDRLWVGWREWLALPALGVPAIKAKIDTGARTSALHVADLEAFTLDGRAMVRFNVHPLQKRSEPVIDCEAAVIDQRTVTDSGGHRELRYVIQTPLQIGNSTWPIEITLTNRKGMLFRMLLGRTAMHGHIVVDPAASYCTGRALAGAYTTHAPNQHPNEFNA